MLRHALTEASVGGVDEELTSSTELLPRVKPQPPVISSDPHPQTKCSSIETSILILCVLAS